MSKYLNIPTRNIILLTSKGVIKLKFTLVYIKRTKMLI